MSLPEKYCASPEQTLRAAALRMEQSSAGIVIVLDDMRRLLGTVTDGDLRRSLLAGFGLDTTIKDLLERKAVSPYARPVSVPEGTAREEILRLMEERVIRHVPVIDSEGRVVELVTNDQLVPHEVIPLQAVIMAGGYGKRLLPLTQNTPKPMLPIGERPLMELMIGQLREAGIHRVNITTHFEPEKIRDYFGDGERFGVNLNYVSEERPLGTAGALRLIESKEEPLLIINGDILTKVDFRAMLRFHNEHHADLTVGVRQFDFEVPYGVIETDGERVIGVSEKPVYKFFVNAGIYLLRPALDQFIPADERFDMTDFIQRLAALGRTVVSFPIMEYWLDIGRHEDYAQAQEDVKTWETTS